MNRIKFATCLCCVMLASLFAEDYNPINDAGYHQAMGQGIDKLKKQNHVLDDKTLNKGLSKTSCSGRLVNFKNRKKMETSEVYNKFRDSILMVGRSYKCGKCPKWHSSIASGFIVSSDGIAVTNYHVMEKTAGNHMAVMTYDKKVYAIEEILAGDKSADIAILKLKGNNFKPIPLSKDNPPGSKVIAITHPDGNFFTVSEGIVSRHYLDRPKNGKQAARMAITADYAKGSSGGPIFNSYGEVVGMVTYTRSIYYTKDQKNLQMVIKGTVPAQSILKLFGK